jgi:ribosomal protein S18 acetylase RimI-like enzyme
VGTRERHPIKQIGDPQHLDLLVAPVSLIPVIVSPSISGQRMQIRRANREDVRLLSPLVQSVVDEVYGYLWHMDPSLDIRAMIASGIAAEDWSKAWVALDGNVIVGTVLTHEDSIEGLWVLHDFRGRGIGRRLLLRGEEEIVERGFYRLRLRMVKTNKRALAFYLRWDGTR